MRCLNPRCVLKLVLGQSLTSWVIITKTRDHSYFALELRDVELLRRLLTVSRERMLRVFRKRLHPVAQLRRMDIQALRGLLYDTPRSLISRTASSLNSRERKLPSLYDPPPAHQNI